MASPITDIASLITSLGPLLLGSGATEGSSTSTVTPGGAGMQSSQDILNALIPQISGTEGTDNVVANIMRQAAIAFAPTLGTQKSSGLYNSSVIQQLSGEAQAAATGQASAAVLQHQTQAANTAAQLAASVMSNSKTVSNTDTKATAPVISPKATIATIAALAGKSILNKFKKDPEDEVEQLAGPAGKEAYSSLNTAGNTGVPGSVTGDITTATDGVNTVNVANTLAGEGMQDAIAGFGAVPGELGETATLAGEAAPELLNTAGDAASEGVASTAIEGSEGFAAAEGGGILDSAIEGFTTGDFLTGAGSIEGAISGGFEVESLAELAALAWIVCTELQKQGRMPVKWYRAGFRTFNEYPSVVKQGYYLWAIPSVRHLRATPKSLYSRFLCTVFNWRAENIAASRGVVGARKLWKGAAVTAVLYPLCFFLGLFCSPDWKSVYREAA